MVGERLKIMATWAVLLFIVNQAAAFFLVAMLGSLTGVLVLIPLAIITSGFAGYQTTVAVSKISGTKKSQLNFMGFSVAVLYGFLASAFLLITTGKFSYNTGGVITIISAVVGGYLAARKIP